MLRGNKAVEPEPTLFDDEGTELESPKSPLTKPAVLFGGSFAGCLLVYLLIGLLRTPNAPSPAPTPAKTAKPASAPAPAAAAAKETSVAEAKPKPAAAAAPKPTPVAKHAQHKEKPTATRPGRAAPVVASTKADAEEPSRSEENGASLPAPIRAKYEEGNVQGALEVARKSHATQWVQKLTRFRASYDAARTALAAHNVDTATRYIQQALDMDEQIAEGWGTYNAELRSELTAISARTTPNAKVPVAPAAKAKKSSIDAAFDK
jgi:hypothetical protein